jgi:heterodisulfide reductase subunit A-like polyferredoxin
MLSSVVLLLVACTSDAFITPTTTTRSTCAAPLSAAKRDGTSDCVVIGSGLGGLSAAALLAQYGYSVTVC